MKVLTRCDFLHSSGKKNKFLEVQGKDSQSVFHPANNPSKLTNSNTESENIPECSPVICPWCSTSPLSADFIDEAGPHYLLLPYLKQTNQLLSCSLSLSRLLNLRMLQLKPEEPLQTNWAPRRSREVASEGHHTPRVEREMGKASTCFQCKRPTNKRNFCLVLISFFLKIYISMNFLGEWERVELLGR